MNGIERQFGVLTKHVKHLKVTSTLISFLVLFAISCIGLIANAQEPSPAENREQNATAREDALETRQDEFASSSEARQARAEERREEIASTSAARIEERQERAEERRAALTDRTQERIRNLAANISNRMDTVVARMNNIIGRMNSRITKLNARGIDTTEAERHMATAQEEVDAAAAILATIDSVVAEVTGSETPREAWKNARTTYGTVREHLQSAHEALRAAIAALKEAVRTANTDTGVSDAVQNESNTSENDTVEETEETPETVE